MTGPLFDNQQLEALCDALVSGNRLSRHQDVETLLQMCGLIVPERRGNIRSRLLESFSQNLAILRNPVKVLEFVEVACSPAAFLDNREAHEEYRARINAVLALIGKSVGPNGKCVDVKTASTVAEAQQRAAELRQIMAGRGCHQDVLKFCRAELIQDNYFHAVFEAVKSVAQKIRDKTFLAGDGAQLVTQAFGTDEPSWVINDYRTDSHKSEQKGFYNLLIGIFGMFRNPLAHEAKIHWDLTRQDAEDMLSLLSLVHRRIDSARMRPRV